MLSLRLHGSCFHWIMLSASPSVNAHTRANTQPSPASALLVGPQSLLPLYLPVAEMNCVVVLGCERKTPLRLALDPFRGLCEHLSCSKHPFELFRKPKQEGGRVFEMRGFRVLTSLETFTLNNRIISDWLILQNNTETNTGLSPGWV